MNIKILSFFCCLIIISPSVMGDDLSELKAQLKAMQQQMQVMQNKRLDCGSLRSHDLALFVGEALLMRVKSN